MTVASVKILTELIHFVYLILKSNKCRYHYPYHPAKEIPFLLILISNPFTRRKQDNNLQLYPPSWGVDFNITIFFFIFY